MACGSKEAGGVYHPRRPQESPFYRLVERFYPEFEAVFRKRARLRFSDFRWQGSGCSCIEVNAVTRSPS